VRFRFRGKHRDPTPPPPPTPPLKMNVRDRLYQTSPRLDASNPTDIRGGTLRVGRPPGGLAHVEMDVRLDIGAEGCGDRFKFRS